MNKTPEVGYTRAMIADLTGDRAWYDYFNQRETWKPDGRPLTRIEDMSPEWRLNCVQFLERRALAYATKYGRACEAVAWGALGFLSGEMARERVERQLDNEADYARTNPVEWIRSTVLHRALSAGLPTKGKKLRALQERAAHWDACAMRADLASECTCAEVRAAHEASRQKESQDA